MHSVQPYGWQLQRAGRGAGQSSASECGGGRYVRNGGDQSIWLAARPHRCWSKWVLRFPWKLNTVKVVFAAHVHSGHLPHAALKIPPERIITVFNKDLVNSGHLSITATFSVSLEWPLLAGLTVLSVESQKVVITFQQCSVDENQKGLWLYKVYGNSALLVLNGTSLNSDNALLALRWQSGSLWRCLIAL